MADFKQHWHHHTAETSDGVLEWTEFPAPQPFIGCTKLDGRNVAPADAHRYLADLCHPAAALDYIGDGWG